MGFFIIPLYAFALFFTLFVILITFKLVKKYNLLYLKYYFFFLLTFSLIIMINVGKFHIFVIIQDQPFLLFMLIISCFNLLIYPLFPIVLYSFLHFIMSLMEIEVSSLLKKFQIFFWVVLFLFLIYTTINFQSTKDPFLIMTLYRALGIFIHASLFLVLLILFFNLKNIAETHKRKEIRNFGILYCVCLALTDFVLPQLNNLLGAYHIAVHLLSAPLLQIPPLLYLKRYLHNHYVEATLMENKGENLEFFFKKYKISTREKEVLQLILVGKRNAEIEKALFISPHTVRNHIYNIYQKLGIRNRIQIVNLIHATLRRSKAEIQNNLL